MLLTYNGGVNVSIPKGSNGGKERRSGTKVRVNPSREDMKSYTSVSSIQGLW
jgi:hypothetical protein